MPYESQPYRVLRYAVPVIAVAIGLLMSNILWPLMQDRPFVFFVGAVAVSAWLGGLVPGLVATLLSVVAVDYYLIEPRYEIITSQADLIQLLSFAGVAALISWLSEARRRSEQALRASRDQMQIILTGVGDGITAQDGNGQPVFANEAAARIFNFPSAEALINTPIAKINETFEVFDTEGQPVAVNRLPGRRAMNEGISSDMTLKLHFYETDEERWVSTRASPVLDKKGNVILGINITRDITQSRQYFDNLRNERERFKVTLKSIGDGVVTTDTAGRIDFMNTVAEDLTGWREEDAVGKNFREVFQIIHETTREEIANPIEQALTGQTVTLANHAVLISKNGRNHSIEDSAAPIKNQKGETIGAVLVFRDVSDERIIKRVQEQNMRQMREVMDSVAAFIVFMTPEGELIEVNKPALRLTGLKAEDMIGRPLTELYSLTYDEQVQKQVEEAIKKAAAGETVRFDVRAQVANKDILTLDVSIAPIMDERGHISHLVGSAVDVTERKKAEGRLAALANMIDSERQRLRNIVANVPGVVWEAWGEPDAASQRIDFVSDYVESMLGYSVDAWLESLNFWLHVVRPDDSERAAQQIRSIFESGTEGSLQFRWVAKNGRVIPVEAHDTVILDENGKPVGMRGVTMDISERKRTEEALAGYARELARSNEELQQFAYVASHDLQEPLRMVASYLQLIEKRYKNNLDDDAKEFINYAVDGATRMKALINDLLAYSRVGTHGKLFEPVDCEKAFQRTLANLETQIIESGALITHDPMPEIIADEAQIVQLFQNLMSNAIKFSGDKTPEIHVGVRRTGREWQFCVRDNGIGIAPEFIDRIFVLFQRLHTIDEYEGTGIGLSICKKVVERHGGRIWVESQPGNGATFYFTIPENPRWRGAYAHERSGDFTGRG